jgi:hypothetical protein
MMKEATMSVAMRTGDYGLQVGQPALKSVGPITFGPDGILFVADNAAATIFAIDVQDSETPRETRPINIDGLDTRLAAYLGCPRENVVIRDMAVHPSSENVYLSVMRGTGSEAIPLLLKVDRDGTLSEVVLDDVPFSQTAVKSPAVENSERAEARPGRGREGDGTDPGADVKARIVADRRNSVAVTDLAYVDGMLLVAGSSNEEFASTLRRIPFPFSGDALSNSLEIYHVSHSRYETAAPIRTFMPYAGNTSILASYTCTPVVHFSLSDIQSGTQLKGRTVAELGSGNTPIGIVSYKRDGEEYLLISNTKHPLLRIACNDVDRQEGLTQPKEPRGVPREELPHPGVSHMANLNGSYVVMMQQEEVGGSLNLRSYSNASL